MVWAGDNNVLDSTGKPSSPRCPKTVSTDLIGQNDLLGPDFLAVIDATKGSPTYGKVVNTVTVGPLVENEPHHMQYVWHKGDHIFAGGLFTDVTYVVDVSKLPELKLKGVNLPTDTPCGSVPDAYWVLKDGTAYGTYMGGPDVPGPVHLHQRRCGSATASPARPVRWCGSARTARRSPRSRPTPETAEDRAALRQHPAARRSRPAPTRTASRSART